MTVGGVTGSSQALTDSTDYFSRPGSSSLADPVHIDLASEYISGYTPKRDLLSDDKEIGLNTGKNNADSAEH